MRVVIYKIPDKEKVLYNLGLLLCKLCKIDKVGVFCGNKADQAEIDKTLWTFSTNFFLPHDVATGITEQDKKQPVLISDDYEKLNRKILCALSNNDLFFLLQNVNKLNCVDVVVFLTQDDNVDINLMQSKPNIDVVDVFKKNGNNKWFRVV